MNAKEPITTVMTEAISKVPKKVKEGKGKTKTQDEGEVNKDEGKKRKKQEEDKATRKSSRLRA